MCVPRCVCVCVSSLSHTFGYFWQDGGEEVSLRLLASSGGDHVHAGRAGYHLTRLFPPPALLPCTRFRNRKVIERCGEQANEVFQAAGHLNLRDSSIWLVLVDTAVATDYYQSYPIGNTCL